MKSLVFSPLPLESQGYPSDKEIVEKNLFYNNVGNEYYFNGAVRSLQSKDHEIVRYTSGIRFEDFDYGLLINANQIRNYLQPIQQQYNRVINSKLPHVCICVGIDSKPKSAETYLNEETKEWVYKLYSEVLNNSKSMGVRGELTKQVLINEVGIPGNRIDVIGCPSVRYWGKNFIKNPREYPEFNENLKIAVNYTAYSFNYEEGLYLALILKKYKNSFMILTDKVEAELLWYHQEVPENRRHEILPSSPNHPYLKRCRFAATQKSMMGMMKTFNFSGSSGLRVDWGCGGGA